MRILLCAVPFIALAADPAISNLAVDNESHSSARVTFSASPAVNRQIAWDTAAYWEANHSYRYKTSRYDNFRTTQAAIVTGLTPGTTYYACPLVCDASANCIACDDVDDPKVEFTTLAEPDPHLALPALPDLDDFKETITAVPAAGATLSVQSDCSNLQSQITTAASATYEDQTVHVVIPAGTVCSAAAQSVWLPAKSGSGWVVIRSSGTLPAFGTRLDPSEHSEQLATISNTTASSAYGMLGAYETNGYWFSGIEFTHPPFAHEGDVNGTEDGYAGTHLTSNTIHDFVFDRCWFHHRGYPDRARIGLYLGGSSYNVAVLDSHFDNASIWRAYQNGIAVTHTTSAINTYTGGTVYFGNASAEVGGFSIELGGTGTGTFRLYVERDGDVHFVHNIATLSPTCKGCTASYDASPAVPDDAFSLISADGSWAEGTITNATFLTAGASTTGDPWTIQDGSDTGAGWEGAFDIYMENLHHLIVRNNYLGATGISVYNDSGYTLYDAEFVRNTFQSDTNLFVPVAGDSNRIGLRRQHFELKNGHTILVEGNQFLDAWASVYGVPSSAIYIANTEAGNMHDITIRNNLIVKHPSCFQFLGTTFNSLHNPVLRRLLVENNVCEADALTWRNLRASTVEWDPALRGHQIMTAMGGEDYTIRHNTFFGGLGFQPYTLMLADEPYEGLTVQDNIFFVQQSSLGAGWGKGIQSRLIYANAAGVPAISSSTPYAYGTAALNEIARRVPSMPSWVFDHNVMVAGCTSAANCVSGSTDLLNVASEMDAYPSGNFWPTGATYGEQIAAVGWTAPGAAEASDYSLIAESDYKGQGTSGSDPGVDWAALLAALNGEAEPEPEPDPDPPTHNSSFRGTVILRGTVSLP